MVAHVLVNMWEEVDPFWVDPEGILTFGVHDTADELTSKFLLIFKPNVFLFFKSKESMMRHIL